MDIKDVIHSKRIEHGMTMKDLAKAVGAIIDDLIKSAQ